ERDLADGLPVARGLGTAERRAPSLWNLAWSRSFFWDGRADSLWSQALQPIENEVEMGGDRVAIARYVAGDPVLSEAYGRVFGALPAPGQLARLPERAKPMPASADDPRHRAWEAMSPDDRAAVDRIFVDLGKALAA